MKTRILTPKRNDSTRLLCSMSKAEKETSTFEVCPSYPTEIVKKTTSTFSTMARRKKITFNTSVV